MLIIGQLRCLWCLLITKRKIMKHYVKLILITTCIILSSILSFSQSKRNKNILSRWEKAVINIETERRVYNMHILDSLLQQAESKGYNKYQMDSIKNLINYTINSTGTAIYIQFNRMKYIVTAKHVISDEILIDQKKFEDRTGIAKWDTLEAIAPRVSLRTPFKYYSDSNKFNNFAVLPNSFYKGLLPFFFISDSTGDGIGVISLQAKFFKSLDTLLMINGYVPIDISTSINSKDINILDEIYSIGYPEGVSVVGRLLQPPNFPISQQIELVKSFTVKGSVSMYDKKIEHYFVDLTIISGNSGGPIIKDGKLIGIVSGTNIYNIIDPATGGPSKQNLVARGNLVNVINVNKLMSALKNYQEKECEY